MFKKILIYQWLVFGSWAWGHKNHLWQPLFQGVMLEQPLFLTPFLDDPQEFWVLERTGKIKALREGRKDFELRADLSPLLSAQDSEMGLLGLAFDPDFKKNRINYTAKNVLRTHVVRFTYHPEKKILLLDSQKILLQIDQPYSNHNGGMLAFGPDGFLYIGVGDGGSAGDPIGASQNRNVLLGKLLRIDLKSGDPYSVPGDNPFVGIPNARPEIYACRTLKRLLQIA